MMIHNPKNLNLPALCYNKGTERKNIESDTSIKSLIDSKLLLDKDLNQLLIDFLGKSKEIDRLFEKNERQIKDFDNFDIILKKKRRKSKELEDLKKEIASIRQTENKKVSIKIDKISNETQEILDKFEKKHDVKLEILENSTTFTCKECEQILCKGRFHASVCACSKKITRAAECNNLNVFKLNNNTSQFIGSNMWLEYGIDYLFRKLGFETMCGVYILGHSGVEHEIDNIAYIIKDNSRVFAECKTTDISRKDVFVFAGKMGDIGCVKGYIFTTSFDTHPNVMLLAKAKNIRIIEQVLERKNEDLMKYIS